MEEIIEEEVFEQGETVLVEGNKERVFVVKHNGLYYCEANTIKDTLVGYESIEKLPKKNELKEEVEKLKMLYDICFKRITELIEKQLLK